MKHGYFKGKKVAECQDSQTSLMDRFRKQGLVDEWRDAEQQPAAKAEAERIAAEKAAAVKAEAERLAAEQNKKQEDQPKGGIGKANGGGYGGGKEKS
jgi:hypothetical protein